MKFCEKSILSSFVQGVNTSKIVRLLKLYRCGEGVQLVDMSLRSVKMGLRKNSPLESRGHVVQFQGGERTVDGPNSLRMHGKSWIQNVV